MSVVALLVCGWLTVFGSGTMTDPVLVTGYEAVMQNPALLGGQGEPTGSIEYSGVGVRPRLTGFGVEDYARYFSRPVRLDEADKQRILDRIGTNPVRLELDTDVRVMHAQYRMLGIGADFENVITLALPHDWFDLALRGNELNRTYRLDGLAADTLSYSRVSGAAGFGVGRRMRVGVGIAWLRGSKYAHTVSSTGRLLTTPYEVSGSLVQVWDRAAGGDGFGLTLGWTWQPGPAWRFGASLRDLAAGIWWNRESGRRTTRLELAPFSVYKLYLQPELDSFLVRADEFRPGGTIWTRVPGVMAAGIGWTPATWMRASVLANLPLGWNPFATEPPLAGLRVELRPARAIGFSLMGGWHRHAGWVGRAMLGTNLRNLEMAVGAELWGCSPSEVHDAEFRLSIGYNFD